ncbi:MULTISPECIES: MBL fold metallo-hydrolase [unclassified Isoptericola]|uniref:MBL fold metallo-hydrolase n=1 Tax=unclassified Isoptericola TaxID=2623355 RepID=UPI002712AC40|nr:MULTISPECIES: MBL fold metallo-hydrolase [unclassified Isoptericola]MDO8144957.1 MBL fold metallo-hydrolase [Isoptericola sp. 178]MDO8148590.1 MBL fold metallo-hydrolase [Isoptericola sp. b515]MDO8151464.1 MBL fold metallo-hydrolase [Isoptericola sp. b408]
MTARDQRADVTAVSVGPMDNNAYLVTCRATGSRLLVDAAADAPALLELLDGRGLDTVVTTHRHRDHLGALADVVAATGARTAAGADDAAAITAATGVAIDERLHHDDTVRVGALELGVLNLRGHTPGSVALALDGAGGPTRLFTGDSLFPGGVGNTDHDPARFTQLLDDVVTRVFAAFDDETIVLPGHGAATTLGAERPHLAAWRERGW